MKGLLSFLFQAVKVISLVNLQSGKARLTLTLADELALPR